MRKILLAGAAVALAAALPNPVAAADRASATFMQKAARAGLAEVELSRLALERSTDVDVRRFAQRMVDEHGRANADLAALARSEGVTLPLSLDRAHRNTFNRLRRLRGNAFDRAYIDAMRQDHNQAVALFRTMARNARDRDVRDWAARVLPTLQDHHMMAQSVRRDERRETRRY